MNSLTIPIHDPAFENLKKSGRLLHLLAALLIAVNAFTHLREPGGSSIFFWTQVIVAADIFVLVMAGSQLLTESPRFNLLFRFIEGLFFLGVGIHMLVKGYWIICSIQLVIAAGYFYIFYCEQKSRLTEAVGFHHLGVTVPQFPGTRLIYWVHVTSVECNGREITIHTSPDKSHCFTLCADLDSEELGELERFREFYLKG